MMHWVSAAALAARGVHIRTGTLLLALVVLLIAAGIIYAVRRVRSTGRKPPSDQQGSYLPRDREEPRSWQ